MSDTERAPAFNMKVGDGNTQVGWYVLNPEKTAKYKEDLRAAGDNRECAVYDLELLG